MVSVWMVNAVRGGTGSENRISMMFFTGSYRCEQACPGQVTERIPRFFAFSARLGEWLVAGFEVQVGSDAGVIVKDIKKQVHMNNADRDLFKILPVISELAVGHVRIPCFPAYALLRRDLCICACFKK